MIFGFLVKALKFLIDGFASVCAFLLVTLGLWLPAVYSLLFLIVCAIAGIKLQGTVITLYIVGLVLTFSGSVAISVFRARRKKRSKRGSARAVQTNVKSVKKSDYADYADYSDRRAERYESDGASDYYQSEPAPVTEALPQSHEPPRSATASSAKSELYENKKEFKYDDFADLRKKYFGDENASDVLPATQQSKAPADSYGGVLSESGFSQSRESYGFLPEIPHDALSREHLERRLMGIETEEKPMIFATRRDPDVIVYEYSDRLKFFRKTKRGLIHISTEFKK